MNTLGNLLPAADCRIKAFGLIGKKFRSYCGRLYLEYCGKDVNIYKYSKISSRVQLGNHSDIGYKARIQGKCVIGNYVMMGPECGIWTVNHNHTSIDVPMILQENEREKAVFIENDVWIGSRVTILPGVTIGTGSIIGAGAVVSKEIPPFSIAVGNPARVVKKRNSEGLCE